MSKLLIGGLAVIALALTGCVATSEPAPTVAQTVTSETESSSSTSLTPDELFIVMMKSVDTPSYFLKGELLVVLQDQAKSTCGYIREGTSKEDILSSLMLAIQLSDADQEVLDAFMAATAAAVYSYCPEYKGFWN
jgi:hypothetical protein